MRARFRAVEDLVAVGPEAEARVVLEAHPHAGRARCERRNENCRKRGNHGETDETIHEIEAPSNSVGSQTTGQTTEVLSRGCKACRLRGTAPGRPSRLLLLQTEPRHEGGDSAGIAVLGGGPAGLTAAYVLALRGVPGTVYEADGTVGGIAKTVEFNGYRFDLGGHRFFTKLAPVRRLWEDMLGDEFLLRPRLSRIYYQGKFISYPLRAEDVFQRLGLLESARCALSYLWSRRLFRMKPESFEDWVTMRFGKRLYEAFFRSYTEKVWGIPGSEIRSEWAAQRIKNFSLGHAVKAILGLGREHVTSLIEEFRYPRLGPGQMWETFAERLRAADIPVRLNHRVVSVRHSGSRVESVVVEANGREQESPVEAVLSSIPLSELVQRLDPPAPSEVLAAAAKLRYRELCLVALITTEAAPFPDNWIYLHDPGTRAGRVQNFGAWSEAMVQPGTSCLGVEYFCFEGDDIWEMSRRAGG